VGSWGDAEGVPGVLVSGFSILDSPRCAYFSIRSE